MPGKNLIKEYSENTYYHIYNRGVNKQPIFLDYSDKEVFLSLFKRYLSEMLEKTPKREQHPSYIDDIELLAFCLMKNHFHIFVYQISDPNSITKFMRSLTTSYSMYYNKKYKRVGPLFQQRYRAVRINDDAQLLHISRYIHLNPNDYESYGWSSYSYYLGLKNADWIKPGRILELFDGDYKAFVAEYKDRRDELDLFKTELANSD